MAETKTAPKESPIKTHDHDRVVMASRKADGTADQTSDYTYIGDKETSIEATKTQLSQQAVSGVDVERRGVGDRTGDEGGNEPDPQVKKLIDAHDSATKAAESKAEAEVKGRFEDVTE